MDPQGQLFCPLFVTLPRRFFVSRSCGFVRLCRQHHDRRSVFSRLGLPLHPSKCAGPTPVLIFLGIELNSLTQTARLPHDKLISTLELLYQWASKKWCTRTELESLIGSLIIMSLRLFHLVARFSAA